MNFVIKSVQQCCSGCCVRINGLFEASRIVLRKHNVFNKIFCKYIGRLFSSEVFVFFPTCIPPGTMISHRQLHNTDG